MTPLHCPHCGSRCGTAVVRDDGDHVDVTPHRGRGAIIVHRLSEPATWPVDWPCVQCLRTVELDHETARRVLRGRRLVLR